MAMYMSIRLFFCLIVIRYNKVDAVSAVQGSIIQLECPYKATGGKAINWNKLINGNAKAYTIGTAINPNLPEELKSRLQVTVDHTAGEYHLSITDVQMSDEGTYECALSGTAGISRRQLTVITNIPTSVNIENVGLDKKLKGTEGRNLMIRCSAVGGNPAPDVKLLISESVVTVAKSSVQYTLSSVNRAHDGQNIKCLAGYEEIPYFPQNESARIYLKLKPYPPKFSSGSVITEETKPLVISCTSTGSRPMASIYWLLGNGKINVTTNATQSSHSHDPTTDTYSVTSTLKYSVNRINNGQNLICGAINEATSEPGGSVETSKTLNVTYAPDITVNSPTYTQNDDIRTVTCNPSGNPDSYTFHKWQQKTRYGEIVQEFGGNKTLKFPYVSVVNRYQDSGEYVCTVSNGIRDKDNKFEQTGSGYVTMNAQPVFTSDTINRIKQFGEISKAIDIYVNVYSVPKFTNYIWSRDGNPITTQNSAKYESSSSSTIVKDKIHGKEVQLDGYNVTLTIRDLKAQDFNNYTLTLKSGFATVTHIVMLKFTSVPETPGNFSMITKSTTSITVQWDPKNGGGHKQAFYIQYRVQGSFDWYTASAGEEDINEPKRRRTYEVTNLQEGKAYGLRMYAENRAGKRSNVTEVFITVTESSETSTTTNAVIGGVIGAVVVLGIVCTSVMVIVLLKRRKGQNQTEKNDKSYENTGFQERQKDDEYEEVRNKCDVQQKQPSKSYETLGTKDTLNVYDGLENSKGLTPSKSSLGHYEALGVQDTPSIYCDLENQKEHTQLRQQLTEKNPLQASNNPKENLELKTTQGPMENVYANEEF